MHIDAVWIPCNSSNPLPPTAFYAGSLRGKALYIGRRLHNDVYELVNIIPEMNTAYSIGNQSHIEDFEVLCGTGYEWVTASDELLKDGICASTHTTKPIYIGRGLKLHYPSNWHHLGSINYERNRVNVPQLNKKPYSVKLKEYLMGTNVRPRMCYLHFISLFNCEIISILIEFSVG